MRRLQASKKSGILQLQCIEEALYSATCSTFMRFFFCAMKPGREYYGLTGYRDPAKLTRGKVLYNIVQQFHMLRRTKTTIIELCCRGCNTEEIMERILCYQSMPKGDKWGKPACYGECDKAAFCIKCLNSNGTVNRLYRDVDVEKNKFTGWDENERVSYTSYVKTLSILTVLLLFNPIIGVQHRSQYL